MSGASLVQGCFEQRTYWDKRSFASEKEWEDAIEKSTCVYVGNLSVYTSEDQIYYHFSQVGIVERVQMGLCKLGENKGKPAGFCFVFYQKPSEAKSAVRVLNRTKLDEREIRVDADPGNDIDERKYGRGQKTGMQVRDDFRSTYDRGRLGQGGGQVKLRTFHPHRGGATPYAENMALRN